MISGPTDLEPPPGVQVTHVKTGKDFLDASISNLPTDIFISVAAISDWRITKIRKNKIKTFTDNFKKISFERNFDVLKEVSSSNLRPELVIGFAAETENLIENSKEKLKKKRCDWIFGNLVSDKVGFNNPKNKVLFVRKNKTIQWPKLEKRDIAKKIVSEISKHFAKQ